MEVTANGASASVASSAVPDPMAPTAIGSDDVASGRGPTSSDAPLADWVLPVSDCMGKVVNVMDKDLQGKMQCWC